MLSLRTWILLIAAVLCAICLTVLRSLPDPSHIEGAGNAADLNQSVNDLGSARLGFALGFDYLFMAAYVTLIGLGCATVAGGARGFLRLLGFLLAYAQIVTGLIDATENAALIRLILNGFDEGTMSVARLATESKFVIPIAGSLYIVIVWAIRKLGISIN